MNTFNTKVTFNTIKNDLNKSDSAIREAIANAIDAKSKNIHIKLYSEEMQGTTVKVSYFCLDISDDGEGIPTNREDFENVFCRYKDSDKKEKSNYGKKGRGRYTYLTLTNDPDSVSIYTKRDEKNFKINFECKNNENIKISLIELNKKIETPIQANYTTLVQFKHLDQKKFGITKNEESEYIDYIKNDVISFFADRIASKSVSIYLNNELLNIDHYLEQEIVSKIIEQDEIEFNVDFYIWNEKIKLKSDRQKHILFFDADNSLKGIAPSGKYKLAFSGYTRDHSIIVKSKYFNERDFTEISDHYDNLLTDAIIKNLRAKISFVLEGILFKIYKSNIDKVSDEYIRFLKLSQDAITQNVYHTLMLPFVEKFGNRNIPSEIKSIIANLINILASEAPDSFINNLDTILNLKVEDSQKLQYVQENYGIIKAITEKEKIIRRIDFLNTFDNLVNGKDKKSVKERTQLHQVIDKHLWLIDEKFEDVQYSDIWSDKALQTILEKDEFYQFDSEKLKEIVSKHDISKIPDIYIPCQKDNVIYIVELKKPNVPINRTILDEVEDKYVRTIEQINKKYQNSKKKIVAFAISDSKTDNARTRGRFDDDVYIEPKCWSELIEATRDRYNAKIEALDNKLKSSHWKDMNDFILSHNENFK